MGIVVDCGGSLTVTARVVVAVSGVVVGVVAARDDGVAAVVGVGAGVEAKAALPLSPAQAAAINANISTGPVSH
ncbi:hypothetical protein HQ535_06370 [bacterium]|nr:hypothetical protein [bacterium]